MNFVEEKKSVLANTAQDLKGSSTLGINKIIATLKDVIKLTAGEPDQEIPKYIKNAAKEAVEQKSNNKYTSSAGLPELRHEIVKNLNKFLKKDEDKFNSNDVIVANGCKQALFNLFLLTLNKDDEVIIPTPFWPSYEDMIKLFGGKPVFLPFNEDLSFSIESLKQAISNSTKFILLNYPNNPSGVIYSKELLKEVVKLAIEKDLYIIVDEIYDFLIFDEKKYVSMASIILDLDPNFLNNLFIINGLSKKYCMMGWRLGWTISKNKKFIETAQNLQSQSVSNVCNIVQQAAISGLIEENNNTQNYQDFIAKIQHSYKLRKNLMCEMLAELNQYNINFLEPDGAFYIFLNIKDFLNHTNKNADQVMEELLYQKHVAVISGKNFGSKHHLRISFTQDLPILRLGCEKIIEYFKENLIK